MATQKREIQLSVESRSFAFTLNGCSNAKERLSLEFPQEKIIGWLTWLAGKIREHSQSVFLVEGLQPSWLDTRAKRVAYGTVVALSLGLIFALTYVLTFVLRFGLTHGLTYELIFALIASVGVGLGCLVGIALEKWRY